MGKMGILGRATGFRCVKRGGYFLRAINATPAAANQPHQGIEDKSKLELLAGGAEPLGGALLCVTMAPLEAGGALDWVTIAGVEDGGALDCVTVAGLLACAHAGAPGPGGTAWTGAASEASTLAAYPGVVPYRFPTQSEGSQRPGAAPG
jgi:hypothetical protein